MKLDLVTHAKEAVVIAGLFAVGIGLAPSTPAAPVKEGLVASTAFVSDPGDGPGGCTYSAGDFVCHVTLSNPASSTEKVSWRSWDLDAGGQVTLPATVSPAAGTLAPGKSIRVTVSTSQCGFSLADLANFLGWSGSAQAGAPPLGVAVLFSCG
jgi:hypothetical protein